MCARVRARSNELLCTAQLLPCRPEGRKAASEKQAKGRGCWCLPRKKLPGPRHFPRPPAGWGCVAASRARLQGGLKGSGRAVRAGNAGTGPRPERRSVQSRAWRVDCPASRGRSSRRPPPAKVRPFQLHSVAAGTAARSPGKQGGGAGLCAPLGASWLSSLCCLASRPLRPDSPLRLFLFCTFLQLSS